MGRSWTLLTHNSNTNTQRETHVSSTGGSYSYLARFVQFVLSKIPGTSAWWRSFLEGNVHPFGRSVSARHQYRLRKQTQPQWCRYKNNRNVWIKGHLPKDQTIWRYCKQNSAFHRKLYEAVWDHPPICASHQTTRPVAAHAESGITNEVLLCPWSFKLCTPSTTVHFNNATDRTATSWDLGRVHEGQFLCYQRCCWIHINRTGPWDWTRESRTQGYWRHSWNHAEWKITGQILSHCTWTFEYTTRIWETVLHWQQREANTASWAYRGETHPSNTKRSQTQCSISRAWKPIWILGWGWDIQPAHQSSYDWNCYQRYHPAWWDWTTDVWRFCQWTLNRRKTLCVGQNVQKETENFQKCKCNGRN